ncbi:hypothetical protein TeGR_g13136 [Tetraparma gracilis]|uniref:Phytanoyl-CoA dioxygenase n=1 Tax=Tetraparma gracilis TaxID=2962635 RepID=A0ABQ6MJC8_9STRA|nr:hypothetical protein TeGR_g13136 [Tetraparma gracilis]
MSASLSSLLASASKERGPPETWQLPSHGLVSSSLAQSKGAWDVRSSPPIKEAFGKIWSSTNLIVSMDCIILWRSWADDAALKPETEGMHLDQNPFSKPDLACVQGMVPLLAVTPEIGGLQVVPGSHEGPRKDAFKAAHPRMEGGGDWCPASEEYARAVEGDATLLCCEAGDLILWDSRTVHGGKVGSGGAGGTGGLARAAVTVSMVPREWASEEVLKERREGFRVGATFNHSPHEAGSSTGTVKSALSSAYVPVELSADQISLL